MMKNILLVAFIFSFCTTQSQSYFGFLQDNYAGVHSVMINPSSIADSRFKTDINLISVHGGYINNYYSASLSDFFTEDFDFENNAKKTPLSKNSLVSNVDLLGPSFMFNLSPKSTIAVFTRARGIVHTTNIDGRLLNDINDENAIDSYSINNQNFNLAANSWSEIGISYARVLSDKNKHFFKAGFSLKYLYGFSSAYLKVENFSSNYNDTGDSSTSTYTTTGTITTGNLNSYDAFGDDLEQNGFGYGVDLGVTYEYRPDYEANSGLKNKNKYLYRIGFSITDIGAMKYEDALSNTYNANATFSQSQNDNGDFDDYYTITETSNTIQSKLPTAIHTNIDWNFHKKLFLNFNSDLSLISNIATNASYIANNLSITPRLETKWLSIYLPFNYIKYSGMQAGFGFRAGPLFVGSGSVISGLLGQTKALDIHFGLKIPIYRGKSRI